MERKKGCLKVKITLNFTLLDSCGGSKRQDNVSTKSEEVTESKYTNSEDGKGLVRKREFGKKLDEIGQEIETKRYNVKRNDGIKDNTELKKVSDEGCEKWEAALAEITEVIKENIDSSEKSKFEEVESKWTKEREERAKKDSDGITDETVRALKYIESKEQTTKDRCYDLITNYMKKEKGSV